MKTKITVPDVLLAFAQLRALKRIGHETKVKRGKVLYYYKGGPVASFDGKVIIFDGVEKRKASPTGTFLGRILAYALNKEHVEDVWQFLQDTCMPYISSHNWGWGKYRYPLPLYINAENRKVLNNISEDRYIKHLRLLSDAFSIYRTIQGAKNLDFKIPADEQDRICNLLMKGFGDWQDLYRIKAITLLGEEAIKNHKKTVEKVLLAFLHNLPISYVSHNIKALLEIRDIIDRSDLNLPQFRSALSVKLLEFSLSKT